MFTLLLILLLTAVTLAVALFVGGLFLQGFFYTVPSEGLRWQAPAAGVVLAAFLTVWCLLVVNSDTPGPQDIPYDTLFRFSPRVDMVKEPLPEFEATKKDKSSTKYVRHHVWTGRSQYEYKDSGNRRWNGQGVMEIRFKHDGQVHVLEAVKVETGGNREFVDKSAGWTMVEHDSGPTGIPTAFRWGRFLFNLFLNFVHFALWFVCLWLLMRFQWGHAFGLALAMWFLMTLAILPLLLSYAAEVAVKTG